MRSASRSWWVCLCMALWASGCAVVVRHNPQLGTDRLRSAPPRSVAVLRFANESGVAMAGAMARDTLFYALADKGFLMVDLAAIDERLDNGAIAVSLRSPDGKINLEAVREVLGADAVAGGRVSRAQPKGLLPLSWSAFQVEAWLIDTRTKQDLWKDRATAWVRVLDLPGGPASLTPAEKRQKELLQLCRSLDRLWQRLLRDVPRTTPEPTLSPVAVNRCVVRPTRPVVSTGDRVDIVVEGTPKCTAQATLGTVGTIIPLPEQAEGRGVYRGSYTIQPGDRSQYCRLTIALGGGASHRQKIADPRSGFLVDTAAPEPPTALVFETRREGVLLNWNPPANRDVSHYVVYRSASDESGVRPLATPRANSYIDRTALGSRQYVYFVKAVDLAGNPSQSSSEMAVRMPDQGPSSVGGKIEGEVRWTAYGGPYRLTADVEVTTGSRLVIEPGARIEIPPGLQIVVYGAVEAIGRPDEPIVVVGNQAACGFRLAAGKARLQASYVEISGGQTAVEIAGGEAYLDRVTLRQNEVGLNAPRASAVTVSQSRLEGNTHGAIVRAKAEIRSCEFVDNQTGLRLIGDDIRLEDCLFDNARIDIAKFGAKPLRVDGNTFGIDSPGELFDHLWGNITCSQVVVRKGPFGRKSSVQFEPAAIAEAKGDSAAADFEWEYALSAYKAALLQNRNRQTVDKALNMYKQIVDAQGPAAVDREIGFCRSAALAFPSDARLLEHLADLLFQRGKDGEARQICAQILRIDKNNAFAKKGLAGAP